LQDEREEENEKEEREEEQSQVIRVMRALIDAGADVNDTVHPP
jgi:hypothetical protein